MRTLRADRHIDRVECVTHQVPLSQSTVGDTKGDSLVVGEGLDLSGLYLDGARREMLVGGAVSEPAIVKDIGKNMYLDRQLFKMPGPGKFFNQFR